jgi:HEAT repeat protein
MRKTRAGKFLKKTLIPFTLASALAISSCATPFYDSLYASNKKPLTAEQLKRQEQRVKELVKKLKHGDWYSRHDAVQELKEIGSILAVPALIGALKDNEHMVAEEAMEALGTIAKANPNSSEVAKAVPALSKALQYRWARGNALEALTNIGKPAVPALSRALEQVDAWFKDDVIDALGKIGKPAIPALYKELRFNNMYLAGKALEALAEIGNPAIPALLEAMSYPELKWKVSWVLKNMDKSAVPALIKAVEDFDSRVPSMLVGFANYDEESKHKIVAALTKALKYFSTPMQKEAVKALGEIGEKKAVPALIEALQDMNAHVRLEIVTALKKIDDRSGLPALSRLAKKDPDKHVRKAAKDALMYMKMGLAW